MDGTWGKESPLNTVGKLSAIATKTKGQLEYARWIVACVKDRILSKQSSLNDGWSEELLTSSRDKSNKGIIDLYMYKLDMKTYLLGGSLESHPFQSEAKVDLRKMFQSHENYRLLFKPVALTPLEQDSPQGQGIPAVDLGFMGSWRKRTERVCELVEELCFMSKHDGLLKVAMKARKTPTEFFTSYESNKEKMDEVLKEVADETAAVVANSEPKDGEQGNVVAASSLDSVDALDVVEAELVASGADVDDIAKYRTQAERRVKAFVNFVSIAGMSEEQVEAVVAGSSAGKSPSCTLLYDPKLVGESRTAPHTRVPPFNEDHALAVVGGFTSCRATAGHVAAGDQIMIMDATKKGLNNKMIPRVFQDGEREGEIQHSNASHPDLFTAKLDGPPTRGEDPCCPPAN